MNASSSTFSVKIAAWKSSLFSFSLYPSASLVITKTWFCRAGYLLKMRRWFFVKFSSIQIPVSNGLRKTSDCLNPRFGSGSSFTLSVMIKSMPTYRFMWSTTCAFTIVGETFHIWSIFRLRVDILSSKFKYWFAEFFRLMLKSMSLALLPPLLLSK